MDKIVATQRQSSRPEPSWVWVSETKTIDRYLGCQIKAALIALCLPQMAHTLVYDNVYHIYRLLCVVTAMQS